MEWFSSDLHFCHNKEFIYRARGFSSIEEHDEAIIENWNSVVSSEDNVYLLGDLMLENNEKGIELLKRLRGWKQVIIIGNHDTNTRLNLYANNLNPSIIDYADLVKFGKWEFYLSHYPTMTANFDDKGIKKHLINLSGHTHSKDKFYNGNPFVYNVSLDAHNMFPVDLDTIKKDIKKGYENYVLQ